MSSRRPMSPVELTCSACQRVVAVADPFADPLPHACPTCGAPLLLPTPADAGFVNRRGDFVPPRRARPIGPACELERTGSTCCGLPEPCRQEPCCTRA